MFRWLKDHFILLGCIVLITALGAAWWVREANSTPNWTTTVVERGDVSERVAVSGFIEATDIAELSFPTSGSVTDVFVRKGDRVEAGQLLATLGAAQLIAERASAVAALSEALASRQALEAGPTSEARAVTSSTVASAADALAETIATEEKRVATARASLLSNGLAAVSIDGDEEAAPPTVSGTYTCTEEGTYVIEPYRSNTLSGYSFRFTGLEEGVTSASTEQPSALGDCGLFVQFDTNSNYSDSVWRIDVPNVRSATYLTFQNAYELALRQQTQNVAAARNALALSQNQATAENAGPRVESLLQANASVQAAQARIAAVDARIADTSIAAPFAGTITEVGVVVGETPGTQPVITLVGENAYTITARIPEIDITKIATGQAAEVRFDARSEESYRGSVSFISPLPSLINNVAYFDTLVAIDILPEWIRSGLNADIDIILRTEEDTLRLPTRFIDQTTTEPTVLLPAGNRTRSVPIDVNFIGNDGYAAITGLTEGDTVVAPGN